MKHRLSLASLALVLACGPMFTGCQGMGATSAREQAMALLSDSVKAEVNGYLQDVDSLTALLGKVNGLQSALDTAPKLAPYVTKLQSAYGSLSSLDPETLKNVRAAFSPELNKAADGFTTELERIADSAGIGHVLKPVLDKIKLFK
ncbi:MAG: hypothetical protein U0572_09125 [Phycisphaerales bacterium]